jgi:hypothetical protein
MVSKLKIISWFYQTGALLLFSIGVLSQSRTAIELKDFTPAEYPKLNLISVSLRPEELDKIHNTTGVKLKFSSPGITVNESRTDSGTIELRGTSSLAFRRKSFSFKLPDMILFNLPKDTFGLKKFFAISLNMDKNYIRNAIALEAFHRMGINVPTHCYSDLLLNHSSEGIYMVYYPPSDYIMNEGGANFILRRGYQEAMENVHSKNLTKAQERELMKKFTMIYDRILFNNSGTKLLTKLSETLDLKEYFDWLIFNFIFQNGDYTDEIYFYWDPVINKFKIMPWDLDDLFQKFPHEGRAVRSEQQTDKLLYSLEDKMDMAIAGDPVLYHEYLKEFRRFLTEFNSEKLRLVLEDVYFRVYPYFTDPEIIRQSGYDKYGLTSLNNLKKDVSNIYQTVSDRMAILDNTLRMHGY